jgi:uncharacterized protein involved in type VI secretion and phage assembly
MLGEVTDVRDPDGRARVKVKLHSFVDVDGQEGTLWARVAVPLAGASRGTFLFPDVGDEVLVTFIGGDPRFPVVIGSLWNGRDAPTESIGDRGMDRWSFQSKDGARVSVIEQQQGQSTLRLEVPGGVSAELAQAEGGKITITAANSTITIDSEGVSIETSGTASVQASTLDVSAASVSFDTPFAQFSGVVQCTTLQATTVVGSMYTPGAGNIW